MHGTSVHGVSSCTLPLKVVALKPKIGDAVKLIGTHTCSAIANALRGRTGAAVKARWYSICEVNPQLAGTGNP